MFKLTEELMDQWVDASTKQRTHFVRARFVIKKLAEAYKQLAQQNTDWVKYMPRDVAIQYLTDYRDALSAATELDEVFDTLAEDATSEKAILEGILKCAS